MRAKDIMTQNVISISPDHSIQHAAKVMLEHHVSGLPVIDDAGEIKGMLTEGDLLRRSEFATATWVVDSQGAIAKKRADPGEYIKGTSWRVGEVMSSQVFSVDEDCPVAHIVKLMTTHEIKRIPVIHDGKVTGIVSRADLLKALVAIEPERIATGDPALQRAIITRLVSDLGLDRDAIAVDVANCNVLLSGVVPSEAQRQAACLAAESVPGVNGVINHLRVGGSKRV